MNRATSQSELGSDTTSVLLMTLLRNNESQSQSQEEEEMLSVCSYSFQSQVQTQTQIRIQSQDLEEGNRACEEEEVVNPPLTVSFFSPLSSSFASRPPHSSFSLHHEDSLYLEEIDLER